MTLGPRGYIDQKNHFISLKLMCGGFSKQGGTVSRTLDSPLSKGIVCILAYFFSGRKGDFIGVGRFYARFYLVGAGHGDHGGVVAGKAKRWKIKFGFALGACSLAVAVLFITGGYNGERFIRLAARGISLRKLCFFS